MTQELNKINFSDNALVILENRYLSPDESAEQRLWDMCQYVASAEKDLDIDYWASKFYNELIVPKKFLPNSPTIVNAGSKTKKGGLQACNVISPKDTLESIYQTVKDWALTEKFGAGIGAYFGDIRAKGSPIGTTHGKALGPVAIMKILSESSKWITQGSFREGAHMAILQIDHPDILEFIHCKDDCQSPDDILHNFNISIQMSDWFMEAVYNHESVTKQPGGDEDYTFPVKELWSEICKSAWKTGDPGLFFIDRIRETEPNPQLGLIQAPNPCGEQPLENYNSCNLGSINLGMFVVQFIKEELDKGNKYIVVNNLPRIDWDSLKETIHLAVRFLDDVIDVNIFPDEVPQLNEMNQKTRRIGLGVMGWHDMLVKLRIPYESDEAMNLAEEISKFLSIEAWNASLKLGEEKGEFPEWNNSDLKKGRKRGTFVKDYDWITVGPRNSCVTTVAPTGTLNILAGCSSGIEPYYSLYTERKTIWEQGRSQATIVEIPETLKDLVNANEYNSIRDNPVMFNNPESIQSWLQSYKYTELFKTALEISPEWHIKHQAAWQKHITNGISKTINLPNNATVEDISNAYIMAWKISCKGVTIYRDGCKDTQVLNMTEQAARNMAMQMGNEIDEKIINLETSITSNIPNQQIIHPKKRPLLVSGDTTKINSGHGKVYVTVNSMNGTPIEIFCSSGKAGKCDSATTEAITRLISLCLRSNIDPNEVVEQLRNITCCPVWDGGFQIMSVPDAISKVLHDHIWDDLSFTKENMEHVIQDLKEDNLYSEPRYLGCIECGGRLTFNEGCMVCQSCGWTRCG